MIIITLLILTTAFTLFLGECRSKKKEITTQIFGWILLIFGITLAYYSKGGSHAV